MTGVLVERWHLETETAACKGKMVWRHKEKTATYQSGKTWGYQEPGENTGPILPHSLRTNRHYQYLGFRLPWDNISLLFKPPSLWHFITAIPAQYLAQIALFKIALSVPLVFSTALITIKYLRLSATPWAVAHQAPLPMGFSRQEYLCGLPFPSRGHLPDPGIKPGSPTLQADSFSTEPPGKPLSILYM